jgi:hypothetical protein
MEAIRWNRGRNYCARRISSSGLLYTFDTDRSFPRASSVPGVRVARRLICLGWLLVATLKICSLLRDQISYQGSDELWLWQPWSVARLDETSPPAVAGEQPYPRQIRGHPVSRTLQSDCHHRPASGAALDRQAAVQRFRPVTHDLHAHAAPTI